MIAFSLWGEAPAYWIGARRNIQLAQVFYPGYRCRFYVEDDAPGGLLRLLQGDDVEIVPRRRKDAFEGMFWRFAAAADPAVDVALFRDCDSRIGKREAEAVAAWLRSGKDVHIMRDHPWHGAPMLGGMWGCRAGALADIGERISTWSRFDAFGCDQRFLEQRIYPLLTGRTLEHAEFGWEFGNPTVAFPSQREDYEFVGEKFDECERRHAVHHGKIKKVLQRQRLRSRLAALFGREPRPRTMIAPAE